MVDLVSTLLSVASSRHWLKINSDRCDLDYTLRYRNLPDEAGVGEFDSSLDLNPIGDDWRFDDFDWNTSGHPGLIEEKRDIGALEMVQLFRATCRSCYRAFDSAAKLVEHSRVECQPPEGWASLMWKRLGVKPSVE